MSISHEAWEVVDPGKGSRLSRLVDRYRMQQEIAGVEAALEEATVTDEREDLRDLRTYGIDPGAAADYDDVFSIRKEVDDGALEGYTAWIHIADVAAYIPEDSVIDVYARQQGFTAYGEEVDHMLPDDLVSKLGFREARDRLANTFELSFDADGGLVSYDIYPSVVQADRLLSYQEANEHMHRSKTVPWMGEGGKQLQEDLYDALFLATALSDTDTRGLNRDGAHRIVEEFMITANEIGANELFSAGRGLYRNHVDRIGEQAGKAYYFPDCRAHDGLGVDRYAHFTSPIRRYSDLVNWRIVREETEKEEDDLQELAAHLNRRQDQLQ